MSIKRWSKSLSRLVRVSPSNSTNSKNVTLSSNSPSRSKWVTLRRRCRCCESSWPRWRSRRRRVWTWSRTWTVRRYAWWRRPKWDTSRGSRSWRERLRRSRGSLKRILRRCKRSLRSNCSSWRTSMRLKGID